jgi:hypothetical protein
MNRVPVMNGIQKKHGKQAVKGVHPVDEIYNAEQE